MNTDKENLDHLTLIVKRFQIIGTKAVHVLLWCIIPGKEQLKIHLIAIFYQVRGGKKTPFCKKKPGQ